MTTYAAYPKKVKIGTDVMPATAASMNRGAEVLDDSKLGQANRYRSRIVGLIDWSVNVSGDYDAADASIVAIEAAWAAGTAVTVVYLPDGTNGVTGSAVVESFNVSGDVGGKEVFELTLQADGALAATP